MVLPSYSSTSVIGDATTSASPRAAGSSQAISFRSPRHGQGQGIAVEYEDAQWPLAAMGIDDPMVRADDPLAGAELARRWD